MNDQQVVDFVKHNKVHAKEGFICVDGRYHSSKYAGMLARPGGNFRGIMTLLALRKKLGLTVGQCVDTAIKAVENMGITFNMHTDTNENHGDLSSIGCGHITKAEDPEHAKEYGVDPMDVKAALIYLKIKLESKKYYKMVELEGKHQEKGVLVITGTQYSVNHCDHHTGQMYFVFDKVRDDIYTQTLFKKLKLPKISFAEFLKVSDMQLNATLRNLAKGLPVYEVNLDSKEPSIKFVNTIR